MFPRNQPDRSAPRGPRRAVSLRTARRAAALGVLGVVVWAVLREIIGHDD